jgi:signal transduction histidine kinase/HAMP domain-containing protein
MRASIAFKIFLGFVLVLVTFIAVQSYSLYQMATVQLRMELLVYTYIPLNADLTSALSIHNNEQEVLDNAAQNPSYFASRQPINPLKLLEKAKGLLDAAADPAYEAQLTRARKQLDDSIADTRAYLTKRSDLVAELKAKPPQEMKPLGASESKLLRELESLQKAIDQSLTRLQKLVQTRIRSIAGDAKRIEENAALGVAVLSIIALFLGVGVAAIALITIRPLGRLAGAARQVGQGEEPGPLALPSKDEIGALSREFDKMVRSLKARDLKLREKHDALAALTRFHSDIVRSIASGIVVVGKDGVARSANPAGVALWGLDPLSVEGRPLSGLPLASALPPESQRQIASGVERVLAGESAGEALRGLSYGKSPHEKVVDLRIIPFSDAAGDIEGALLIGEEVTEELRTKARLLQSERLATVGRMAAQIAHEIRNPLSSIGLNAELLEDDLAGREEGRRLLKAIQTEVDRLAAITEDYLRYARLPSPQRAPGDLNAVARSLCEFLAPEAASRGVKLVPELAADLPTLRLDEAQLRQALLNLVRNAFEVLEGGGPELPAEAELQDAARRGAARRAHSRGGVIKISTRELADAVELAISDDGPGIPPEIVDRIFEPFFSTKSGGTGLGLALTLQIIEGHGGQLRVETTPGAGATFLIRFPLA